jgi:hypothetical protein
METEITQLVILGNYAIIESVVYPFVGVFVAYALANVIIEARGELHME